MITRSEKERFVDESIKALKSYKTIGIIRLNRVPDKLLQRSRNSMSSSAKLILGRKTLLKRILESDENTARLSELLDGTSAILLSNAEPFELYREFSSNTLKLRAKPNQLAPSEIVINSGETALQPGQAVTELKQAGLDVQIQKGKVIIAKEKVIKTGELITTGLSKALGTLGITPFFATIEPFAILSGKLLLTKEVLSLTPEKLSAKMVRAFNEALQVSLAANIINSFTIRGMLAKAYRSAMHLGIEYNIYDSGIIEKLIEKAALQGKGINAGNDVKT
jgi:large subunit ribosomal protein L10